MNSFQMASTPSLQVGAGKVSVLPKLISAYGKQVLLITGARSFQAAAYRGPLLQSLEEAGHHVHQYVIGGEPSPQLIDTAVAQFAAPMPDVVVAIGGGSVLDAGKAISAMLPLQEPVKDYLEGVGIHAAHPGVKVPFIAIPTTAGTGSEATKNAVISEPGANGFKKSLRHEAFVPEVAILDPTLTLSCPPAVTAASGMDAFTQLLESYLSKAANPLTDALAFEGLRRMAASLYRAYTQGDDVLARADVALAAYLSGVTLANAGLGLVHGMAGPIGGLFPVPHGAVCSTLMAPANIVTVRKLRAADTESAQHALVKYAMVGQLFCKETGKPEAYYVDALLDTIQRWTADMKIPSLTQLGITREDFDKIVAASDAKNNPIGMRDEEMWEVLERAA